MFSVVLRNEENVGTKRNYQKHESAFSCENCLALSKKTINSILSNVRFFPTILWCLSIPLKCSKWASNRQWICGNKRWTKYNGSSSSDMKNLLPPDNERENAIISNPAVSPPKLFQTHIFQKSPSEWSLSRYQNEMVKPELCLGWVQMGNHLGSIGDFCCVPCP